MGAAASHDEKPDDDTRVSYDIHNNGSVPFVVTVTDDSIEIYRVSHDENDTGELEETGRELIEEITDYKELYIGKDPSNGANDGNSILIQIKPKTYMFIGETIYTFTPFDPIEYFDSPVGNSDVPYPYAVGTENTYLLTEQVYVPNSAVAEGTDPYQVFYKMDSRAAEIHRKTHGFRVKVLAEAE